MAVLVLLAFASQSFAVVKLPCHEMGHEADAPVIAGAMTMDHGNHSQIIDAGIDNADMAACCSQEQCSQVDCISAGIAAVSNLTPFSVQYSQVLNTGYSVSFLTQEASSLFRPPISR